MSDPREPVNIPLRPLNKGMMRHLPPTGIPPGGMWLVKDYYVDTRGLERRAGWNKTMADNQISEDDQPLIDLVPLWKTDGTQKAFIITNRYGYEFALNAAPTVKYWITSAGTISIGSTSITGTDTQWQSAHTNGWIIAGDQIVFSATESTGVKTVNNDTSLTLSSAPATNAYTTYYIRRVFQVDDAHLPDSVVVAGATNEVVIADYHRPPYTYDGTDLTTMSATMLYVPACVLYFGGSRSDRLWIGNIKEVTTNDFTSETIYRQRIRWSSPTDPTSFSASDYIDLPYASGAIRRMVNIGSLMLVFMADALFFGRPSGIADLPYLFDRVGTGGIGLVGTKAIVPYGNGYFFAGQDNIYWIDENLKLEPIGTPVVNETIQSCDYPNKIYACLDTKHSRVLFGFPESGEAISKIWSYNYESKGWSYSAVGGTFIANPLLELTATIDGLDSYAATIDALDTVFGTIDGMGTDISSVTKVYRGHDGYISELSDDGSADEGVGIQGEIHSGDLDLGHPNMDKTFNRLTLRLLNHPSAVLTFTLYLSDDGGDTWTNKGDFSIATTEREGKIDFRFTCSAVRLRLVSSSVTTSYVIGEVVLRASLRGLESRLD